MKFEKSRGIKARGGFVGLVDKKENLERLLEVQSELLARQEAAVTAHEALVRRQESFLKPVSKFNSEAKKYKFIFYKDFLNEESWEGGYFNSLRTETPQTKGSLGQRAVEIMLQERGFKTTWVGKGEDLRVSRGGDVSPEEVKSKFVNFKPNGEVSVWFNQLRAKKEEIKLYHFVAIFPDKIEVLESLNRDAFDFDKLSSGHGGTKDLKNLTLTRAKDSDVFVNKKLNLVFKTVFTLTAHDIEINVRDLNLKSTFDKR